MGFVTDTIIRLYTIVQKRFHRKGAKNAEKEFFIRILLSLFGVPIKMGPQFPERGILIKLSTPLKTICCFRSKGLSAVCVAGLLYSIFPPLRGKYYKQRLSALCVLREPPQRRGGTGGKFNFLNTPVKNIQLELSLLKITL